MPCEARSSTYAGARRSGPQRETRAPFSSSLETMQRTLLDSIGSLRPDVVKSASLPEAEAFAKDFAAATAALAKPATEGIASALAKAAGPFDAQEEGSDSMGEEA